MQADVTIKAVIFDVGGVLLRTEDPRPRAALAERFGMSYAEIDRFVFGSPSAVQATLGEIDQEAHWEAVGRELKLSPEELREFQDAFWEGDRVDRSLIDFIAGLRPRYRTGLLSNAWSGARAVMRDRFQILDVFDLAVFSAEVGLAKPDERIYRLMLDQMGVTAREAIFVDDFIANIEAARDLGLHGVHFRGADQARAEIVALLQNGARESA